MDELRMPIMETPCHRPVPWTQNASPSPTAPLAWLSGVIAGVPLNHWAFKDSNLRMTLGPPNF